MGRLKSVRPYQAIVVHQWSANPDVAAPPARRFWVLEYAPSENSTKAHPIANPVGDRFEALQEEANAARARLPPLLLYDDHWHSITAYTLTVDKKVAVELNRWGPGLRLTQVQAMKNLFQGTAAEGDDAEHLSATLLAQGEYGEHSVDEILTVAVMNDGNGSASIKYRLARLRCDSVRSLRIPDAYKTPEQTLRTCETPAVSPRPNTLLQAFTIGHTPRYLVLTALHQDKENDKCFLSLYALDSRLALSEANSIATPNEDIGIRWQLQKFELPGDVSAICPIIVQCTNDKYLLLFYVSNGSLRFSQAQYVGSGRFTDFSDGAACVLGRAPGAESSKRRRQSQNSAPARSRFSFLSYKSMMSSTSLSSRSLDIDVEEQDTSHEKERGELPEALVSANSIPYATKANGFVWVFFQDADGNGSYVRHGWCDDIAEYQDGWESNSWETGVSSTGAPTHFIPVTVPCDFMRMQ